MPVNAYENIYGTKGLADYDFSKADTIISIDADILGDWQGGGYDVEYSNGRIPKKNNGKFKMSYHMQFESNMSLSGANADKRIPATPASLKNILAFIYGKLIYERDTKQRTTRLNSQDRNLSLDLGTIICS